MNSYRSHEQSVLWTLRLCSGPELAEGFDCGLLRPPLRASLESLDSARDPEPGRWAGCEAPCRNRSAKRLDVRTSSEPQSNSSSTRLTAEGSRTPRRHVSRPKPATKRSSSFAVAYSRIRELCRLVGLKLRRSFDGKHLLWRFMLVSPCGLKH